MDDGHVIPDEIRALLERRTTFQEWLSKLEHLGSEFRPEVADKVRADYRGRLEGVQTELEGHRSELESALEGRRAAVAEAAGRHDARAAELEECELRYRVGEFDDQEWERRREEHQSDLDQLDAELTTERAAVGSLEAVLGELAGSGAVAAGAISVDEAMEASAEAVVEPALDAVPGPDEAPTGEAPHPAWMTQPFEVPSATEADVDFEAPIEEEVPPVEEEVPPVHEEATAEEAVVQTEAGETSAPVEAVTEAVGDERGTIEKEPSTAGPGERAEFMDELEFLESLSLDDAESFDAVSAMLEDEEGDAEEESDRKPEDA